MSFVKENIKWRPPVFKHFNDKKSIVGTILSAALSTAIAVTMLDIVNEWILHNNKVKGWNVSHTTRRLISFVAAFLGGALSYAILWFLFGTTQ